MKSKANQLRVSEELEVCMVHHALHDATNRGMCVCLTTQRGRCNFQKFICHKRGSNT